MTWMIPLFAVLAALALATGAPCGGPMVSRPTVLAEVAVAVAPAFGAAGPAGAAVVPEPLFGGSATTLSIAPAVSGAADARCLRVSVGA